MEILSQRYYLNGCAATKRGGRSENQDNIGWADTPLGFLLVVCDGMGGGPGGKTASIIATHEVLAALADSSPRASRTESLRAAVARANDALYQKMDEYVQLRGMGSTLVAVLINEHSAIIAHLGDSRCYQLREGRVIYRTTDHSLVGEMVRQKTLTEEQARQSPQSNVIMRALGNTTNHVPDITERAFHTGDRFLLCTDGIWGIMPHEQFVKRLTMQQDVTALVTKLSEEVDQIGFASGGHHDNHTLAIVETKFDSKLKDKMDRKTKWLLSTLTVLLAASLVINVMNINGDDDKEDRNKLLQTISEKNAEIEQLMAYQKMNNKVKDADSKELITRVEVLEYEKEALQRYIDELINKVDSLERAMKIANSKTAMQTATDNTAKVTAQKILNQFDEMMNVSGNELAKTLGKKSGCRNKILALLTELDVKTNHKYKSKIDAVSRELKHERSMALLVAQRNDKKYASTNSAVKKIKELSGKIKEIKDKL